MCLHEVMTSVQYAKIILNENKIFTVSFLYEWFYITMIHLYEYQSKMI